MNILTALRIKQVNRLWSALTLSCIGAEIYSFAIVWIATNRLGYLSSYLVALEAGVILFSTLVSGVFTQGFSNKSMMIFSDYARMIATILPFFVWFLFGNVPLIIIIATMVLVSCFRPIFDPALQAILPGIIKENSLLQAVNGLFDVVRRIARVTGPVLAAFLFSKMSIYYFFTINALTFLISACYITSISKDIDGTRVNPTTNKDNSTQKNNFFKNNMQNIRQGFIMLREKSYINYHLVAYAICNAGWYVSLVVCIALKIHNNYPDKAEYFGYILGIYGFFNVISNLIVSEIKINKPVLFMSVGRILSGAALLCMAMSNQIPYILLFAAIASIGSPITQIPLATLMQTKFNSEFIVCVFRTRMFYEWLFLLIALVISPSLLYWLGITNVMIIASLLYLTLGVYGLVFVRNAKP